MHDYGEPDAEHTRDRSQNEPCDHGQRDVEVLLDDLARPPREPHCERQASQVVGHEDHVCGLHRDSSARAAHGDADRGVRQGGRIVYAVAHHDDLAVALPPLSYQHELVVGKQFGMHLVDTHLPAHCLGDSAVVAGEHDDWANAEGPEPLDHLAHSLAGPVCDTQDPKPPRAVSHRHRAAASGLEPLHGAAHLSWDLEAIFFPEPQVTDLDHLSLDARADTAGRQALQLARLGELDP